MTDNLIRVYWADANDITDQEAFKKLYDILPNWRREKVDRSKREEAKKLSLCAGYLFVYALEKEGRQNLLDKVVLAKHNKPVFIEDGIIASDANCESDDIKPLYFNISHSGTRAMCAISNVNIGCDIQVLRNAKISVANRFFAKQEQDYIFEGDSDDEQTKRFIRIWAMKEAYTKMIGDGIASELNEFSVLSMMDNFWEYIDDEYHYAVYSEEKEFVVELNKVML